MRHRRSFLAGLVLVASLAAGSSPAAAAVSWDFLFSMDHVGDDNQYFLNLAVSNYGYARPVLEPVLPRIHYVEVDLPVILFLAHESGRPLDFIVGLRAKGLSWSVILTQVGVPIDLLFVGIDRDPGPPYGKAWGYWKKRGRAVRLSDRDVQGLVQIQIGSRWVASTPFELAQVRGKGTPVVTYVAEKKGRPYQKAKVAKENDPGAGKGKGKGKGKEKGNPGKGHGKKG